MSYDLSSLTAYMYKIEGRCVWLVVFWQPTGQLKVSLSGDLVNKANKSGRESVIIFLRAN